MTSHAQSTPRLTVSVVVHNSSLELLRHTLDSLRGAAARAAELLGGVAVTLVDNASAAPYRRELERLLGETAVAPGFTVALLQEEENRGYGAGHNRALARDPGDFHLVLNPDVEVAPDALRCGVAYLQAQPSAALLSPLAQGGSGEREFLCKRYPSVLVLALRAFAPGLGRRWFARRMADYEMRELRDVEQPVPVTLASGCFMLARGAQLVSLGGFDERYFLYFEDFDLSLRCAALGEVVYHPGLRIVHHGGYAARKGPRHLLMFARSALRFFRQHGWRWI